MLDQTATIEQSREQDTQARVQHNTKRRTSDTPKPSMAIKRAWHSACFAQRERRGEGRGWKRLPGQWMPLKQFAIKNDAKQWFSNK